MALEKAKKGFSCHKTLEIKTVEFPGQEKYKKASESYLSSFQETMELIGEDT
ncbi:MAG: hypothetical protein NWE78_06800 [Candidatus Bathyarchaeota archaeon]|nr:hypothetical protein [Candidatus Bathyarchaeota archaeon]